MKHIKYTLLILIALSIAFGKPTEIKRGSIFDRNGKTLATYDSILNNKRIYPYGENLVHVVGYLGGMSKDDVHLLKKTSYKRSTFIGKQGIEKQYEELLHNGLSLNLTIDAEFQKKICELLPDSTGSTVIVSNPQNGEIYAAVSWPAFDPAVFNLPKEERAQKGQQLIQSPLRIMWNKFLRGSHPPASLFKPVVALAIPDSFSITMDSKSFNPCSGGYRFERRMYNCLRPKGHKIHSLGEAFISSCHTIFYQLSTKLDDRNINRIAKTIELDTLSFVDLPDERAGYISGEELHNKRFANKGENWKWQQGLSLNLIIGQAQYLSPIIISTILPKILYHSEYAYPHIGKSIRTTFGDIKIPQKTEGSFELNTKSIKQLRKTLFEIVHNPKGVGRRTKLSYIPVGGIPGSAETPLGNRKCDALFSAVAPIDNPKVAVTVIISNGGHGAIVAAELAKKILDIFFTTTKEGKALVEEYADWDGSYPTAH